MQSPIWTFKKRTKHENGIRTLWTKTELNCDFLLTLRLWNTPMKWSEFYSREPQQIQGSNLEIMLLSGSSMRIQLRFGLLLCIENHWNCTFFECIIQYKQIWFNFNWSQFLSELKFVKQTLSCLQSKGIFNCLID